MCPSPSQYYRSFLDRGDSILAVDNLSVGVHVGDCFGLLGVNGAGKSTTFMMLNGQRMVTRGTAYIGGESITGDIRKVNF